MENLKRFIDIYPDYSLSNCLTYNSYRTGSRSETRDWDSVSVTEILWLIVDTNMDMVKRFHSDKMQEACDYWTEQHKAIENYINNKEHLDTEVFKHFKIFTIKHSVTEMQAELEYKITYWDLPTITGTIDCIWLIGSDKYIIDWKTSKWIRSFKSVKYNLQLAWYRWLARINKSAIVYLNKKWYEFSPSKDNEYWDKIWLELLEYANWLYVAGKINNLYT